MNLNGRRLIVLIVDVIMRKKGNFQDLRGMIEIVISIGTILSVLGICSLTLGNYQEKIDRLLKETIKLEQKVSLLSEKISSLGERVSLLEGTLSHFTYGKTFPSPSKVKSRKISFEYL